MKKINKFKYPKKTKTIALVSSVIITSLSLGYVVLAAPWAGPIAAPPGNNADAPINVGGTGQVKIGSVVLNYGDLAGNYAANGLLVRYGNVGIGTLTPSDVLTISGSADEFGMSIISASNTSFLNPLIQGFRSKGTVSAKLQTGVDDTVLELQGLGFDGADYKPAVRVYMQQDGPTQVGRIPGRIDFATTSNGLPVAAPGYAAPSVKMTIKADGNVGIGTTDPKSTLDVNGNLKISGTTEGAETSPNYAGLYMPNTDVIVGGGADSVFAFRHIDVVGRNNLMVFGNQSVGGVANGPGAMTIDSEFRRVGVGSFISGTRPNATLDVNMSSAVPTEGLHIKRNAAMGFSYLNIENETASPIFKIHESGRVGIGTATPGDLLDVRGTAAEMNLQSTGTGATDYSHIHFLNAGGQSYGIGAFSPNVADVNRREKFFISDNTGGNVLFTIDGKVGSPTFGNVGIGTTNPGQKLDVNGNVQAAAFLYSSDERLKENIQKIDGSLNKIMKLDGVYFNWKDSGGAGIGLTAQNVETVFPELVKTDDSTGMKSVEYGNLVAPLVEAIKEQQKMIQNQQHEIDLLKAEIAK